MEGEKVDKRVRNQVRPLSLTAVGLVWSYAKQRPRAYALYSKASKPPFSSRAALIQHFANSSLQPGKGVRREHCTVPDSTGAHRHIHRKNVSKSSKLSGNSKFT